MNYTFLSHSVFCLLCSEANSEADSKRGPPKESNDNIKEDEKVVWPKPAARLSPAVRTRVAPPTDAEVSLPEGCTLLGEISQTATEEAQRIWLVEQHQIKRKFIISLDKETFGFIKG